MVDIAADFGGSIPEYYDTILGPAQLEGMAASLVRRLPVRPKGDVLELACGTGIVTQRLRERIDANFRIVATDINEAMLAYARGKVKGRIDWRIADAAALPFKDATFGLVLCALGVMFVPDKAQCFREARRVLGEGGALVFTVWDRLERNPHARTTAAVLEALFPGDPEMDFARVPCGFHDEELIRRLLGEAGFGAVRIEHAAAPIKAPSARTYATGQIRGTPRSLLIEKKGAKVEEVIENVAVALAAAGGSEPFALEGNYLVVEARAI